MIKMKYLIVVEGKKYKIANDEKTAKQFLINHAKSEKAREVEKTDVWLNEMLEFGCSRVYSHYGDFVLPFENEKDFEII